MHIRGQGRGPRIAGAALVAALPDMGGVGGLVTRHLAGALGCEEAARMSVRDRAWVDQRGGIISWPEDEYVLHACRRSGAIVFTGGAQPREARSVIRLAREAVDAAERVGELRMVVSAGGCAPPGGEGGVFGVATNGRSLDMLRSRGVGVLAEAGSITWFNGLVLGEAKSRGIDGVGLFGAVDGTDAPQYAAAAAVARKVGEVIGADVDAGDLDARAAAPGGGRRQPPAPGGGPGIG